MFNKTAFIKKNRYINHSAQKLYKTLTIKRKIKNLKNSFANSNKQEYSLENISNLNIKTASNSKITSESSILPIKTESNHKIKKNFFFPEENFIINNKSKFFGKKKEKKTEKIRYNKIHSFTNKQISPLKKSVDDNKTKNELKNEYIQCKPNNFISKNQILNIDQQDKKIDNLAKKLILKLNENEYYNKDKIFKFFYGNNITLKNGFFNGENLVVNNDDKQENEKIESKYLNNQFSKKNNKLIKYENNLTTPNDESINYPKKRIIPFNKKNFLPLNLPLFLREKANIQGTEILSPFCKEARDEFLFNKIFNQEGRKFQKRFELIDNKLNIFYAENENQYDERLKKFNNKLKIKGKKFLHVVGPTKDQLKLNKIKSTLSFIKKIFDYSYPNMVLSKVRKSKHEKRNLTEIYIPPYKKAELMKKKRNDYLWKYLRTSIDVNKS